MIIEKEKEKNVKTGEPVSLINTKRHPLSTCGNCKFILSNCSMKSKVIMPTSKKSKSGWKHYVNSCTRKDV